MAYVPLALPDSLTDSVRMAIEIGVEPPLQDVHWMLATRVGISTEAGPPRQLGLPIALVLLTTVAGVSELLLHTDKIRDADKFKECLIRYFPWHIARPIGVPREGAANILYQHFRCPLVHGLGFHKRNEPIFRTVQPFPGSDNAEKDIEELERLTEEPISEHCLLVTPEKRVLHLHQFYWGVRKMVERWSHDDTQVLRADKKLAACVVEGGSNRHGAKKDTNSV